MSLVVGLLVVVAVVVAVAVVVVVVVVMVVVVVIVVVVVVFVVVSFTPLVKITNQSNRLNTLIIISAVQDRFPCCPSDGRTDRPS